MIARGIRLGGGSNAPAPKGDVVARAIQGSLHAPLNTEQKRALAAAARKAYDQHGGSQTGMSFEDWRHDQQHQACGKASLREATQADFKLLRGHFDKLTGKVVNAFRQFVGQSGEGQKRELALAKLRHEAKAAFATPGSPFASAQAAYDYVAGFVRNKRKTELDRASATDIWHGIITLRNKMAGQAKKQDKAEGSDKTRQDSILAGSALARPHTREIPPTPRRVNLRGQSEANQ